MSTNKKSAQNQKAKKKTTLRKLMGEYRREIRRAAPGRDAILDATIRQDRIDEGLVPMPTSFSEMWKEKKGVATRLPGSGVYQEIREADEKGLLKLLQHIHRERQRQMIQQGTKQSAPRPQQVVIEVARKEIEVEHLPVTPEDLKQDLGRGEGDPVVAHIGSKWEEKPKEIVRTQCTAINKGNKKQCRNTTTDPSGLCGTHCKSHVQLEVRRTEDPIVVKEEPRMLPASEVPIPKVKVVEVNDPLPTNQEVDDCMDDLIEQQVPEEKATPLSYAELLLLPKEERQRILADRFHCEVEDLFETVLSKRMKFGFHKSKKEEPTEFEVMYFGLTEENDLVGPFPKRKDVTAPTVYEVPIHRHWEKKDTYLGIVPHPVIDLGYEKWMTLTLPLHTDDEYPCLWEHGIPVEKKDESAEYTIKIFLEKITDYFFKRGELENAVRKGSKMSLTILPDCPDEFKFTKDVENTPLGQRYRRRLGLTMLDGDKSGKRHSQLWDYAARGCLPRNKVTLIRLEQIKWIDVEWTGAQIDKAPTVYQRVIMKSQNLFVKLGYTKSKDTPELRDQFEKALDGTGMLARSFINHSVGLMRHEQEKYGIDPLLIERCDSAYQISFRGLIPGGGQLKAVMQVSDWLPSGYILFHSTNDKTKEWKVEERCDDGSMCRPFRYYWNPKSGKDVSRTNLQYIIANRFLFTDELLHRWFDKMKSDHMRKLETTGIVDDRMDMLESMMNDEDEEDGCGLKKSFTTFTRLAPTELHQWGFNPLEFPKIATAAAQAGTNSWVKLETAQLRIVIPGAVRCQIISHLAYSLMIGYVPKFEKENGLRFDTTRKIAYEPDEQYKITMKNHGGSDGDDDYDITIRQWKDQHVAIVMRAPCQPGDWNMKYVEGDLPESIKKEDIEQIPLDVQDAIKRELPRRSYLIGGRNEIELPTSPRQKKPSYDLSVVKAQINMPSLNPGMLVNMFTDMWIWDREFSLLHAPCSLELLIDTPVQGGLIYGEEGLTHLQVTIQKMYIDRLRELYKRTGAKHLRDLPISIEFWYRKGLTSLFSENEKMMKQIGEVRFDQQMREKDWYYTLLYEMNQKLKDFRDEIEVWVTEKFLSLESKKFYDNTMDISTDPGVEPFITTYSKFCDSQWDYDRGCLLKHLRTALTDCGFPPTKENMLLNKEVFDRYFKNNLKTDERKRHPKAGLEHPWKFDEPTTKNPNPTIYEIRCFDYKWSHDTLPDGRFTKGKRSKIATKVYRTGLGYISAKEIESRPGLESGLFFARALRFCLDTYGSKPVRVEDFLLEENNWNRFMVWLLLEFEVKGTKQLEPIQPTDPEPKEEETTGMKVINCKNRTPGDPKVFYCGRTWSGWTGSPLGNPCSKKGTPCPVCGGDHSQKMGTSLPCYKRWLWTEMKAGNLIDLIKSIPNDAELGCWCAPNPCHCEVIIAAKKFLTANPNHFDKKETTPVPDVVVETTIPKEEPVMQTVTDPILSFQGDYRFLSNFMGGEIKDANGNVWKSPEHAYQALKFPVGEHRDEIRNASSPAQAKKIANSLKDHVRSNWREIRLAVMEKIVRAKFTQKEEMKRQLLATGERELIEGNTWGDTFWGVCNGKGENHLGKILMQIRSELRGS